MILADPTDIPERDRLRSPVEALQWDLAKRLLTLGQNVILEWGFWSREERESVRLEAEDLGATVVLHYCRNARRALGSPFVAQRSAAARYVCRHEG